MYTKFAKRALDIVLSFLALIVLSPVLIILIILGAIIMRGTPFFVQPRPGKGEKIFHLIKFRTMTSSVDSEGKLLPDEMRLTRYGAFLRSTSLDELPELFNILKGDMSIVGPRPQLVRDMVFMTDEQRKRHTVRPGLTGLAQCNGRNNVSWEKKFEYDIQYIQNINFLSDFKIIFRTVGEVINRNDTVREGTATDLDYGDWLIQRGVIDQEFYDEKQKEALKLLYS